MLRTQFEEELLNLHNQFYEMGMLVSSAIHKSVRAYVRHDKEIAQEVIENDLAINNMEVRLEKKSFEMIALQQPVTTDLRMRYPSRSQRFGSKAKRGSPKSKKKSQICRITSKKWLIMS